MKKTEIFASFSVFLAIFLIPQSEALCPQLCSALVLDKLLEKVLESPENDPKTSFLLGNITKSPGDPRDFRGLRLVNGVTVLLISDTSITDGFAALTVAAGGMNDPPDIHGLAHLVEHALFIGSSNSSENISFQKFVALNMGKTNGRTGKDYTTFEFHILNSKLSEALHEFANLFLSPSLSQSDMEKVIMDIETEYRSHILDSGHQKSRLKELLVNPKHPAHQFYMGNSKTLFDDPLSLGVNISLAFDQFFERFYSANLMSLVVGGNYSLDEMQDFVEKEFLAIPNRNVSVETFSEPYYTEKEMQETAEFKLSSDLLMLKIDFMLEDSHYAFSQFQRYIQDLLESDHMGGLLQLLRGQHLAESIQQIFIELSGISLLSIEVNLTEPGFEKTTQVLCHIFEYLNEIQSWEPQEWFWNQLRSAADLEWKFPQSSITHMHEIIDSSINLRKGTPIEEALSADKLLVEFNSEEIKNLLGFISNPLNGKFTFIGNFSVEQVPLQDAFYPIQYGYSPVSSLFTETLSNCTTNAYFTMPQQDFYFLPTDFQLISPNLTAVPADVNWDIPNVIETTNLSKVWWWNALKKFPEPRLALTLTIRSPLANNHPLSRLCSILFISLARESLDFVTQNANKAGISLDVYSRTIGLQIAISGFNDKIPTLVDHILSTVLDHNITNEVDLHSLEYHQIFSGSASKLTPLGQAKRTVLKIFSERLWDKEALQQAYTDLTEDDFYEWKKHYFERVQLEWLFSGNIAPSAAIEIADDAERRFMEAGSQPILTPEDNLASRTILLKQGEESLYMIESETEHNTSATMIVFQLGAKSDPFLEIAANILAINEAGAFYDEIRTKHSLGYDVSANVMCFGTTRAFVLHVHGTKHPAVVEKHIRTFIDSHILQPSPQNFTDHKLKLKEKLVKNIPSLISQHNQFLQLAIDKAPFDDQAMFLQALENITFSQYSEFLQNNFNETSKLKRQLSVYVVPKHMYENDTMTQEVEELLKTKQMFTNILEWKSHQSFHSLDDSL